MKIHTAKPIDFSETRTIKRKNVPSTLEEREYARELNKELPGEWRAITRRIFRKFQIDRSPSLVKRWILNGEADVS